VQTRRRVIAGAILAGSMVLTPRAEAAPPRRPPLKIGVSLALTGPDAWWGVPMLRGVELAIEDVNRGGGTGGHALETVRLDSGASRQDTLSRGHATASHYERLIADPAVIAAIGPQTSAEGRAVAALLSRADLATITPSATTFDITAPAFEGRFRPGGRVVFFRTVGTDLAQGEAMARFARQHLGIRRIILVDDYSEFGARMVETFERHAAAAGITVLARWRPAWSNEDFRPKLRELAGLGPDALYVGVRLAVGIRLARQIPEILPSVRLLGTEAFFNNGFPIQARGMGAEGWYVANVAPHLPAGAWAEGFRRRFGDAPSSYSLTAYTAVTVIADAVDRIVRRGQPVTRARVREAIGSTRLPDALSGSVAFDRNGDLERPAVSIYQIRNGGFHHVTTIVTGGARVGAEAGR
jgi:branched-chain amino acid transport system substrate-binding protein